MFAIAKLNLAKVHPLNSKNMVRNDQNGGNDARHICEYFIYGGWLKLEIKRKIVSVQAYLLSLFYPSAVYTLANQHSERIEFLFKINHKDTFVRSRFCAQCKPDF